MGTENPFDNLRKTLDSKEGPITSYALEHDIVAIKDHLKHLYKVLKSQTDKESRDEISAEIEKYEARLKELESTEND